MMKRLMIPILSLVLCFCCTIHSYGMSRQQSEAIQSLLNEACAKSGSPGISIAIINKGETSFFSSGYADREKKLPAGENTLYELASLSKAFTGVGILLLEEKGQLSMDDPVQKYLPWLKFRYQGKLVDMKTLTLNHFLHHSSGLTNGDHMENIPDDNSPNMLRKAAESLIDAELTFAPGQRYSYGTVNYNILGLVIEAVSGKTFDDYMKKDVLMPLGLQDTYLSEEKAQATGKLAQGYRTSFFASFPYDAPDFRGNKPSGYIISSAKDMSRWMQIQMGEGKGIPPHFKSVIKKSHIGDATVGDAGASHYAAGWVISSDEAFIEHTGSNPGFASDVVLMPQKQTGICLLSNGASTNIGLVKGVSAILDENLNQSYEMSMSTFDDIMFSVITIAMCLMAILFLILGIRRRKKNGTKPLTRKRLFLTVFCLIAAVFAIVLCFVFPSIMGNYDWPTILVWRTYSILTALIAAPFLCISAAWFIYAGRFKG